jgi:hypothetical protein
VFTLFFSAGMSFRIYRLAAKEQEGRGCEKEFAQTITTLYAGRKVGPEKQKGFL